MMVNILNDHIKIFYEFAKQNTDYHFRKEQFHNAFGAAMFAQLIATSKDEWNAIEKLWNKEWRPKWDALMLEALGA